jgi:hypothetical protein
MRLLIRILLCLGSVAVSASGASLMLLSGGDASGWEEQSFQGNTRYRTQELDGEPALRARAEAAASALYREQAVDLERWPVLRWRWRVGASLQVADERSRAGDDFAARVYVSARHPVRFWSTRTICYVWAGRVRVGDDWPNPYNDDVRMLALRSGDAEAGRWVEERRDVAEDFRRLFGDAPQRVEGVAIMTDSDQSATSATAWYQGLRFESR